MHMKRGILAIVFFLTSLCPGCGPTYPRDRVIESVQMLCQREYNLSVKAKLTGKTLGVYSVLKEPIIDGTGNISKNAIDQMGNIFLIVSRVALSTDADIKFCVAVIADPQFRIEWIITRYLRDVKLMYFQVSREEIFRRTDFDLRPMLSQEEFPLRDVTLPDFLARQISTRIKTVFANESKLRKYFEVQTMQTAFKEPEVISLTEGYNGNFVVYYNLKENATTGASFDENELVNTIACQVIRYMVDVYEYSAFDGVELVNMKTYTKNFISKMELMKGYGKQNLDTLLGGLP